MAIIKCEECGASISDKAGSCIHCGNPVGTKSATTIEQTGKQYKLEILIGVVTMLIGLIIAYMMDEHFIGGIIGLIGCAAYLHGKLGAWWGHG